MEHKHISVVTMVAAVMSAVLLLLLFLGVSFREVVGARNIDSPACIWQNVGGQFIPLAEQRMCDRVIETVYKGELPCTDFPSTQYYSYWDGNKVRTFGFMKMCTIPEGRVGQQGIYYWTSWG
jgi:hypothetical protein